MERILDAWDAEEPSAAGNCITRIGEYLQQNHAKGRGILKSAFEKNVPVFVPAFSDSELGIDFALHKMIRLKENRPLLRFDPFEDFEKFADTMLATKRMGIFTIGGGVPRNWAQQFGVYAELLARRGYKDLPLKRYNYGVRVCPEPVSWGGLSGSTYTEAVSWGKFVPDRGRRAPRRSFRRCHRGITADCRRCSRTFGIFRRRRTKDREEKIND